MCESILCLFFADKLTACQKAYKEALKKPKVGKYIPRCKDDGSFENKQCEPVTGQCWCVHKNGREIPGTRTSRNLRCPDPGACNYNVCCKYLSFKLHACVAVFKEQAIMCLLGCHRTPWYSAVLLSLLSVLIFLLSDALIGTVRSEICNFIQRCASRMHRISN